MHIHFYTNPMLLMIVFLTSTVNDVSFSTHLENFPASSQYFPLESTLNDMFVSLDMNVFTYCHIFAVLCKFPQYINTVKIIYFVSFAY